MLMYANNKIARQRVSEARIAETLTVLVNSLTYDLYVSKRLLSAAWNFVCINSLNLHVTRWR